MIHYDLAVLASRTKTHAISVGGVGIGGANPIRVQSMTNTDTRDADATLAQIQALPTVLAPITRIRKEELN